MTSQRVIRLIAAFLFNLLAISASAHQMDAVTGKEKVAQLLKAAQEHLGPLKLDRQDGTERGLLAIYYEVPGKGRFATFLLTPDGRLVEFSVNSPDGLSYTPIKARRRFIDTMMQIASPDSSAAERNWGAEQLDIVWTERTPALPVKIGQYVYQGHRANSHDHFAIIAAGPGVDGLRYENRGRP